MRTRGLSSLTIVLFVSLVATVVMATIESRVLLSLYRARATEDSLAATYGAESEIHDTLARYIGEYTVEANPPDRTLADGTLLSVQTDTIQGVRTIDITATRPFAVTHLRAEWESQLARRTSEDYVDIVFSLDCSASMGDPACDGCSQTRMEKLKEALVAFVDALSLDVGEEATRLGISVFSMKAGWLSTDYDASGNPLPGARRISPDEDLTFSEIKTAIQTGLLDGGGLGGRNTGGRVVSASPACKSVLTETNIGAGLAFLHNELAALPQDHKQIEVLITDGVPNQRTPDDSCPVSVFCPWDGAYCPSGSKRSQLGESWTCPSGSTTACEPYARDYLRCAMATTEDTWTPERIAFIKSKFAWWSLANSVYAFEGLPSPTRTPTSLPTRTRTPYRSPTRTPYRSPTVYRSPTRTPYRSPTVYRSPTRTPTSLPTRTRTPYRSPTRTPYRSPTVYRSPTATPAPLSRSGIRRPDVDLYTVTVLDNPPAEVLSIFNQYATGQYNAQSADQLPELLQMVFQDILQSIQRITIQRVLPGDE